jgi:CRP-like cAMP-binding protein
MADDTDGRREFAAGDTIFDAGDAAESAYLIASGAVDIVIDGDGGESVADTLGPGDLFGEMALIDGSPRSAKAVANEDTVCHLISRADFDAVMKRADALTRAMLMSMTKRLRKATGDADVDIFQSISQ